ncbi:hypothetical protein [Herbiconiux sp.]|uniref:hypothetical protein n=1 Tax=Herbiconiux sp. TaxID=1871186 RepID=UPI0025BC8EAD|nr:hypothetical protein [Herbiconiux sp.]
MARQARTSDGARGRVTGVIVVGMSVAVWWPAFTLGAWGTFFFDQMLTVWAAATGALIVVLFQTRGWVRVRRAFALAIPSVWLALEFIVPDSDNQNLLTLLLALFAGLVAFLAVPTTIWVLARTIWPEFGDDIRWPNRIVIIVSVVLIAVASFALGLNQSSFLTCGDFIISGNSEPPGCTPAPTD